MVPVACAAVCIVLIIDVSYIIGDVKEVNNRACVFVA